MIRKNIFLSLLICCAALLNAKPIATVEADFAGPKTEVSKNLYGIFFEDINYGADGGLYAEMIQNRSFEYSFGTEGWDTIKPHKKNKTRLRKKNATGLNANNPSYGELKITEDGTGCGNEGYGGLPLEVGKTYKGSVYLKCKEGGITEVTVGFDDGKGKEKYAETTISGITNEWKKFEFSLSPSKTTTKGRLTIIAKGIGILHIDMLSLFRPETFKNQPNGMRLDLANLLNDLQPGFMRFPGGCIVEGKGLANAYRWKDTVGPIEERKENANCWGYQQSYGIGFYEYFRFCEDMGCEPVPIINCGMSCQARGVELALMSELDEWIQDALDLIEFANGDVTTTWGKLRADMGHPEPFNMKYLGVGNENWDQIYYERYEEFGWELKEAHPEIKLIFAAGPLASGVLFDNAWNQVPIMRDYIDLVDEHYYMTPEWFLTNTKRYDNYDRKGPKVFVGEYAAHTEGRRNNLYVALAEAAFMTGIERNADIIELASYAPLFAKEGSVQWAPDMIWFNNTDSYGSPSYYAQKMFANNRSDRTVKHSVSIDATQVKPATIGGSIGFGTWQTSAVYANAKVTGLNGRTLWDMSSVNRLSGFAQQSGTWSQSGKAIMQTSMADNCRLILTQGGWDNYTFEVDATKKGGNEAFLIIFGEKNGKFYWWNIGGWGNTQSCIEKGTADARSIVTESKPINIASDRVYKIKVEVHGDTIKCYLDGQLIHTLVDPQSFDPVFAHVGETDTNEVIVKLVNTTDKRQEVNINLKNVNVEATGSVLVMSNPSKTAENSFAQPTAVAPKQETITDASNNFIYKAAPNSINIMRLKKK